MKTIEISAADCKRSAGRQARILKRRIRREARKLERILLRQCSKALSAEGLDAAERELEAAAGELCRNVLRARIEAEDVVCKRLRCGGLSYRCEAATEKEILTGFGKLKYSRRLFRNHLKKSLHLVDERLGLVDGFFTPGAARRLLLLHSRMPVRESVETAAALGPMRCAESRVLKLAGRFGREWDGVREQALAQIRESEPLTGGVEQIMVQLDGAAIRRIEEKQGDGGTEAQWREAANGVVCLLDGKGRCLKTSYFSFMPEALKPRLKLGLAAEVLAAQERYPDAGLVAVADGAPELWAYLEGLNPDAMAVDAWHAIQHLKKACNARYGEGTAMSDRKFRELRRKLVSDPDGVQAVINTLRVWQGNTKGCAAIVQVKNYFLNNRDRMNYAELSAAGHPIGSGKVESANKMIADVRMKRSGQKWTQEGGQAVMDLRSLDKSGRLDAAWQHVLKAFKGKEIRFTKSESDLALAA